MPYNKYYDASRMALPSLRRKSKPANIVGHQTNTTAIPSFSAGKASLVSTEGPEPRSTPHVQPRPRSSWYSQPSISDDQDIPPVPPVHQYVNSSHGYANPYAPELLSEPPSPIPKHNAPTSLTPNALTSLNNVNSYASRNDSVWEDDEPESSGGTREDSPSQYMTKSRHTAVSEYITDRSWGSQQGKHSSRKYEHAWPSPIPAPTSSPPPVSSHSTFSTVARRFSFRSGSKGPLSRRSSKHDLECRRSSITKLPYPVAAGTRPPLPPSTHTSPSTPHVKQRTPSLSFSSPLSMLRTRLDQTPPTPLAPEIISPAESTSTITIGLDPFIATPYDQMRRGPLPIQVTNLRASNNTPAKRIPATTAVARGLSQTYRPIQPSPSAYKHTSSSTDTPTRRHSLRTAPPTYTSAPSHSSPQAPGPQYLPTKTRDPIECSDEGSWLAIGTLRGPTPDGVRTIDEIMAKSLSGKKAGPEKGVKEIRKILKHERRSVIEWVEGYVREKWGCEV